MYISFENLLPNARVWIYQSDKELSFDNLSLISRTLTDFINSWTSHGSEINGSFTILYNRFIVLSENVSTEVSGCSIDKSVHLIQDLSQKTGTQLIDRSICYEIDGEIFSCQPKEIKQLLESHVISAQTIVFDNTITNVQQLKTNWKTPLENTWLKRYVTSQLQPQ